MSESELELVDGTSNLYRDPSYPEPDLRHAKSTPFSAGDFSQVRHADLGRLSLSGKHWRNSSISSTFPWDLAPLSIPLSKRANMPKIGIQSDAQCRCWVLARPGNAFSNRMIETLVGIEPVSRHSDQIRLANASVIRPSKD